MRRHPFPIPNGWFAVAFSDEIAAGELRAVHYFGRDLVLFRGESVSETIAAVLTAEPDLSELPANTPPKVRRLIERCLRRDPQSRLRDIGDARVVVEESLAGGEWENAAFERRTSRT